MRSLESLGEIEVLVSFSLCLNLGTVRQLNYEILNPEKNTQKNLHFYFKVF